MLHKTRGIVLHSIKYSETSLIVKTYTEAFGLQSYMLKGIRSQKAKTSPALFQPLTLLELVVYHKEKTSLHPVKEVRLAIPTHSTSSDIRKSSIALFLAELLYRTIREEEANLQLFNFLWSSFIQLDKTDEHVAHFHLLFSMKLCAFLGFQPQENRNEYNRFFHLREGSFHPLFTSPDDSLDEAQSACFYQLLTTEMEQLSLLSFSPATRSEMLDKILRYYRHHLSGFGEIRSREVLHTVLS
ncbi:MAG: DNA repair protein RecO [Bacteroidales bacterium]|nr:DNA repair protein RecO [Bacteroidales bacterium]